MEMPSGWAKLVNDFNSERLAYSMQLMKEMAEALELCTEYYPEVDHLSKMEEMRKLNAALTLKKFKQWK